MMVSFCAVLFQRGVLDEILNLTESVSEGFPSSLSNGKIKLYINESRSLYTEKLFKTFYIII